MKAPVKTFQVKLEIAELRNSMQLYIVKREKEGLHFMFMPLIEILSNIEEFKTILNSNIWNFSFNPPKTP